ncbi:MAG: hypothetical protein OXC79_13575 [Candidatus Poribacteria bacterium]|nr:hypothetical protein [Candidatus Poribacteria bacterium]
MKKHPVLASLDGTDFLRALTLLTTNANRSNTAPSCTRRDILELKVKDYKRWADITEDGFIQAAKFLSDQKIFRAKDLPYQTQLIALAAIFGGVKSAFESAYKLLEEAPEEHVETAIKEEVRKASMAQLDRDQKISRWYWCGVFGEMYAGAANTQIANDFSEMTSWLREEEAGINSNQMDEILDSHLIFGDALREDNFDKFFDLRKEALLEVIKKVMGKKVVREPDKPVIFDIEALLNGPDAQH